MKAVLSKDVGGPETLVLEALPDPVAGPGQVLIDVKACGVNYPDVLIIEDKYQFKPPRPFAPGGEISGVVKAVGPGVTHLKVGDRVLGNTGWGGMAEEALLDASRLIPIPDAMPFDEAAAFIMTYGTSYYALKNRGRAKAGESSGGQLTLVNQPPAITSLPKAASASTSSSAPKSTADHAAPFHRATRFAGMPSTLVKWPAAYR